MLNGVAIFFVLNCRCESDLRLRENFVQNLCNFVQKRPDLCKKTAFFAILKNTPEKRKSLDFSRLLIGGQRRDRTADTRIFSPNFYYKIIICFQYVIKVWFLVCANFVHFHLKTASSALRFSSSKTWAYFKVVLMLAWPKISFVIRRLFVFFNIHVAAVWRRV